MYDRASAATAAITKRSSAFTTGACGLTVTYAARPIDRRHAAFTSVEIAAVAVVLVDLRVSGGQRTCPHMA